MTDKDAFLAALRAAPWNDELPHLVYADWLDEHGEHEEAERQRAFVPALRVLLRYAIPWYADDGIYYLDNGREVKSLDELTEAEVDQGRREIDRWVSFVRDENNIVFNDDDTNDHLRDRKVRTEFWKAFTIVTGVVPSETLQNQDYYSCAC